MSDDSTVINNSPNDSISEVTKLLQNVDITDSIINGLASANLITENDAKELTSSLSDESDDWGGQNSSDSDFNTNYLVNDITIPIDDEIQLSSDALDKAEHQITERLAIEKLSLELDAKERATNLKEQKEREDEILKKIKQEKEDLEYARKLAENEKQVSFQSQHIYIPSHDTKQAYIPSQYQQTNYQSNISSSSSQSNNNEVTLLYKRPQIIVPAYKELSTPSNLSNTNRHLVTNNTNESLIINNNDNSTFSSSQNQSNIPPHQFGLNTNEPLIINNNENVTKPLIINYSDNYPTFGSSQNLTQHQSSEVPQYWGRFRLQIGQITSINSNINIKWKNPVCLHVFHSDYDATYGRSVVYVSYNGRDMSEYFLGFAESDMIGSIYIKGKSLEINSTVMKLITKLN